MRIAPVGGLSGFVLLNGMLLAAAASPISNEAQTAANFLLATCQSSADNLSAVAQLAEQQNWSAMLYPRDPESAALKVNGMWRVSQNGQSYIVATGTGPRGKTTCQVMFNDPKPRRDDFMAAISHVLTLETDLDQMMADMRLEIHRIENLEPKYVVLQVASKPDGSVFEASVHSR